MIYAAVISSLKGIKDHARRERVARSSYHGNMEQGRSARKESGKWKRNGGKMREHNGTGQDNCALLQMVWCGDPNGIETKKILLKPLQIPIEECKSQDCET